MTFRIHPAALAEAAEAAAWYEIRSDGLGHSFTDFYDRGRVAIRTSPDRYPFADDAPPGTEVRNFLLARFPYRIVYAVLGDRLVIVAVAHTSRRPGYWSNRLADTIPPEDAT